MIWLVCRATGKRPQILIVAPARLSHARPICFGAPAAKSRPGEPRFARMRLRTVSSKVFKPRVLRRPAFDGLTTSGSSMNRPRSAATCRASFASRFALVFLAALMGFSSVSLFAQSANTFYKRGEAAEAREDYDAAYENYQQAATKSPSDLRYREALIRVRTSASGLHLTKGRKLVVTGDLQGAMAEYLRAAEIDPGNEAAQQEIARLRALQGQAAPAPAETSPEMATRQEEIESMGAPVTLRPVTTEPFSLHMSEDAKVVYQ